jgi:hypothetical protein
VSSFPRWRRADPDRVPGAYQLAGGGVSQVVASVTIAIAAMSRG